MPGTYDFGYMWQWTHGHLVPAALFAVFALLAWRRSWPGWLTGLGALGALWGLAGFMIVQVRFAPNAPLPLPPVEFLPSGVGEVLDIGAGSGRATVAVLLAKPQAHVTALDRFASGYGIEGNSPERLRANARAAHAEDRLRIQTGDARQMPFADGSFDAAVSSFVIDHLGYEGQKRTLAEVRRVLRPDGRFLLVVINRDRWVAFAYPFLHGHGYFGQMPARQHWLAAMGEAGLETIEDGTLPGTLYVVARKRRIE